MSLLNTVLEDLDRRTSEQQTPNALGLQLPVTSDRAGSNGQRYKTLLLLCLMALILALAWQTDSLPRLRIGEAIDAGGKLITDDLSIAAQGRPANELDSALARQWPEAFPAA